MAVLAKGCPEMSFMLLADNPSPGHEPYRAQSYGSRNGLRHIAAAAFCGLVLCAAAVSCANADTPVKIVVLGDSLTAGLGLPEREGFVPRLQAALAAKGLAAEVVNAGVSGDTATDGLARLDWSVPDGTQAVIVELGANDMLRGVNPQATRAALDGILRRLSDRRIAVLLCGMRAAPNLGADYGGAFERIYPELAVKYGTLYYPFFLDGVAGERSLNQHDGLHPTASGVETIVTRILPQVEELVARARHPHPS